MMILDGTMGNYLKKDIFGVESELDPAGLLLVLGTKTHREAGGQEYRPQSRT